jgi:hypothetical protein
MLFFIPLMMLIFMECSKKKDANKLVILNNHPAKPIILQSTYNASADHKKEKKLIQEKIKRLDTIINSRFDQLKDWASNVGEAIEMME